MYNWEQIYRETMVSGSYIYNNYYVIIIKGKYFNNNKENLVKVTISDDTSTDTASTRTTCTCITPSPSPLSSPTTAQTG